MTWRFDLCASTSVPHRLTEDGCPWPTTILVSDGWLDHISRQLFSVRHRYQRDSRFPGWTFNDVGHAEGGDYAQDRTILRYHDSNGNFWLWRLTGQKSHEGYYHVASWMD